jgi:hypothetical protein
VAGTTYYRNDIVLINSGTDDAPADDRVHELIQLSWVGRLIDFRVPCKDGTPDSSDVIVLVQWLYKPEEIPGGRKPYHGTTEVIPSNWIDIIDPTTIGPQVRVFWRNEDLEDEEETSWGDKDLSRPPRDYQKDDDGTDLKLYWRQYYDAQARTLTPPQKHCTCRRPCNLHELMIKCERCNLWLHATCIAQAAVEDAKLVDGKTWLAEVKEKGDGSDVHHIELTLPDSKRKAQFKELRCLKCKETID